VEADSRLCYANSMRILLALTVFAACGSAPAKKESSIVHDKEQSPSCCCKTIPLVGEHEIKPNFAMTERMECSSQQGECVDDVQCANNEGSAAGQGNSDGVPPPPPLAPSTESGVGQ
jgi:hypothetical protein